MLVLLLYVLYVVFMLVFHFLTLTWAGVYFVLVLRPLSLVAPFFTTGGLPSCRSVVDSSALQESRYFG